jgi:hypothetical protein
LIFSFIIFADHFSKESKLFVVGNIACYHAPVQEPSLILFASNAEASDAGLILLSG